jgi:hypothetical protein
MISRDDFEAHEKREDKDRDERRQAESSIRDKAAASEFERRQAEGRIQDSVKELDKKLDSRWDQIVKMFMDLTK